MLLVASASTDGVAGPGAAGGTATATVASGTAATTAARDGTGDETLDVSFEAEAEADAAHEEKDDAEAASLVTDVSGTRVAAGRGSRRRAVVAVVASVRATALAARAFFDVACSAAAERCVAAGVVPVTVGAVDMVDVVDTVDVADVADTARTAAVGARGDCCGRTGADGGVGAHVVVVLGTMAKLSAAALSLGVRNTVSLSGRAGDEADVDVDVA